MSATYEAIIVGSGAGGAAAAFRLAESGRRILIFEKGLHLPTDGSTLNADVVLREGRYQRAPVTPAPRHGEDGAGKGHHGRRA